MPERKPQAYDVLSYNGQLKFRITIEVQPAAHGLAICFLVAAYACYCLELLAIGQIITDLHDVGC